MSSYENRQDIAFLLFLVPFALSGVYGLYLWVTAGLSAVLPQSVFLDVTESPYVFLAGFFAVIGGVMLDVLTEPPDKRKAKLVKESDTLQKIAIASFVLGALSAWYAAGFDPGQGAVNVLDGRYVVVFPALLVVFSFLLLPSVKFNRSQARSLLTIACFLAIPVSVDEIGKRNFYAGMITGFAFLVAALYLYLAGQKGKSA